MGTNYYLTEQTCACCGRQEHQHIGKSSAGWTFSLSGASGLRSWHEWKDKLTTSTGEINDEYGNNITPYELITLVEQSQQRPGAINHAREYPGGLNYLDPDGYSFSDTEFS